MKKIINWIKNYAYYYKFYAIIALIIIAIAVFAIWQITSAKAYDYKVYLALSENASGGLTKSISAVCTQYGEDVDSNGSVNAEIIDLSYNIADPQNISSMEKATLLMGEMQAGGDYFFVVDKERFEMLQESEFFEKQNGCNSFDNFAYSIKNTEVEEYLKTALRAAGVDPETLPELYVAMRKAPEKSNEKQYELYTRDKQIFENIIKAE